MNRELFRNLTLLSQNQPWVDKKMDRLEDLLFKDCVTHDERELLISLVSRIEYLDSERFVQILKDLALDIVSDPELHDRSTVVTAMTMGHDADSGQLVLYSLKTILQELNWSSYKHVNNAAHAYKTIMSSAPHRDIVLVDEFVGSGKTVIDRVKSIISQFGTDKKDEFSIKVKVIAATEEGLNNVKKAGINISSQITMSKGITDYYPEDIRKEYIDKMLKLEDILSKKYNNRSLPSLGYGFAEALYYRADGNIPNSVFPIFWWNRYRNESTRLTLFTRAMGDA
ncbi:Uncharacterised protein [Yersinia rohdei]|uniref:phosphoribosyltransferase-like protein n=1 Tax=Yersinia rohdei TaxID=29485 RepID=UPI0005DD6392|nr:hypothetical protein [Yersinia rohdei]CNI36395.1 Uncharacterised protein [Yersinia rohdei]